MIVSVLLIGCGGCATVPPETTWCRGTAEVMLFILTYPAVGHSLPLQEEEIRIESDSVVRRKNVDLHDPSRTQNRGERVWAFRGREPAVGLFRCFFENEPPSAGVLDRSLGLTIVDEATGRVVGCEPDFRGALLGYHCLYRLVSSGNRAELTKLAKTAMLTDRRDWPDVEPRSMDVPEFVDMLSRPPERALGAWRLVRVNVHRSTGGCGVSFVRVLTDGVYCALTFEKKDKRWAWTKGLLYDPVY